MKSVQVGGFTGSGSHLVFNILRNMLEESGFGVQVQIGSTHRDYSKIGSRTKQIDYFLLKNHDYKPSVDIHFATVRDLRDVATNYVLKNNLDLSVEQAQKQLYEHLTKNIEILKRFKESEKDVAFIRYEGLKSRPREVATEMLLYVLTEKSVSMSSIEEIVNRSESELLLESPSVHEAGFRSNDFWKKAGMVQEDATNNGKVGGYTEHLPRDIVKNIEETHKDWMREFFYLT